MMEFLGPPVTFAFYSAICIGGWIGVFLIYPETKSMGLEEVRQLLSNGWRVNESLERQHSFWR